MKSSQSLILLLTAIPFFLASCTKDDSSVTTHSSEKTKVIISDAEKIGLDTSKLESYIIRSSGDDIQATEESISVESGSSDVIALIDDGEQPVLVARKFEGDSVVNLSLASTAEMMVLFNPHFSGRKSSNPKELSRRIRSHEDFRKLEESIAIAITTGNPCPISPRCNAYSARIALKIAGSIVIEDLYQGE
ncbi:MAG: hypothetical protein CSB47_11085 [Proteobacteria bacterium]|nr:MAG: hypothetical protein CSB47_11085 [Pseudomonadota bacterium]